MYGGTERVVSYLTEELVAQGHQVTLFASGDSVTRARLRPMAKRGLRLDPDCKDALAHHIVMLDHVMEAAREFDVVHFHIDYLNFPFSRKMRTPSLTTLHGRLDLPDLVPVYRRFRETPLVSISDAQRKPLPWARWVATIHHGLPRRLYPFSAQPGSYLGFLGRISPEKRPDRAIRLALAAGIPLKIAAKVDQVDRAYYEKEIQPLLGAPGIEFVGEIEEAHKARFLGGALALLFPIDWPEPFGLVMIESMACGTPVIAYRCGSVPEVMADGQTGFVVEDDLQALAAVRRVGTVDRAGCRRVFDERFCVERMARDYLRTYRSLILAEQPEASAA
jgi:glycosyltransferase involved in cell wall biosynthesis